MIKTFEEFDVRTELNNITKSMSREKWNEQQLDIIKKSINEIRYNNIKIDRNVLHELFKIQYHISSNEYTNKKVDDVDIWHFIPHDLDELNDELKALKRKYKNYNFYELGAGFGINCLLAEKHGFKAKGFEIDENLLKMANDIGLGDLVEHKNIFHLKKEELKSPKIIYFYQPIKDNKKMFEYEINLVNNIMNKGDILFRFITYDFDERHQIDKVTNIKRLDSYLTDMPEICCRRPSFIKIS